MQEMKRKLKFNQGARQLYHRADVIDKEMMHCWRGEGTYDQVVVIMILPCELRMNTPVMLEWELGEVILPMKEKLLSPQCRYASSLLLLKELKPKSLSYIGNARSKDLIFFHNFKTWCLWAVGWDIARWLIVNSGINIQSEACDVSDLMLKFKNEL